MDVDVDALWAETKPDERGLVTAVVQDAGTGAVLMVAAMSKEALALTIERGRATFWSRSRGTLWEKGETSGHTLDVEEVRIDCDGDAILVRARPAGPTCHTGESSCFFRVRTDATWRPSGAPAGAAADVLTRVFATVLERKAGRGATHAGGKSYVRTLLEGGTPAIVAKIREESDELVRALENESDERVAAEAADLLFHVLVGLAGRGVGLDRVLAVLAGRLGTSGIDEKAARGRG